jgi:hypothetical protein
MNHSSVPLRISNGIFSEIVHFLPKSQLLSHGLLGLLDMVTIPQIKVIAKIPIMWRDLLSFKEA